jgi:predicted nucleic acid-binding protein
MVIFDANVLISLDSESGSDNLSKCISALIRELIAEKTIIGIPAPAWAEYLCGAGLATAAVINLLRKRSAVRILPFDELAAMELAVIDRTTRLEGPKRGAAKAGWQKVKVDRQILAITRVHAATAIYSDDDALVAEAHRMALAVRRTRDISEPCNMTGNA